MMEAEIRRTPGFPLKESEKKAYRRTRANQDNKKTQRTNSLFTCLAAGGSEAKP